MVATFKGFPRALERSAIRPGRWFVAARGVRPILCFATDVRLGEDFLALTFSTSGVDQIEFAPVLLSAVPAPLGTLEDEIVFTPGLSGSAPLLVAPVRRLFTSGSLLRLKSGDLGIGFTTKPSDELHVVSLATGERVEGFDLVFERWSLSLARDKVESMLGHFRPASVASDIRRAGLGLKS
jgi:hypothetical protein